VFAISGSTSAEIDAKRSFEDWRSQAGAWEREELENAEVSPNRDTFDHFDPLKILRSNLGMNNVQCEALLVSS
jgi:hypothetical protein